MKSYPAAIVVIDDQNSFSCVPFKVQADDADVARNEANAVADKLFSGERYFVFVNPDGVRPVDAETVEVTYRGPACG